MIDLSRDEIIYLCDAADFLPRRSDGKKVHSNTLFRWASAGLRGVVLETGKVGGRRATSKNALQRFCEQLSMPVRQPLLAPSRRRSADWAEKELIREGFGGQKTG